MALNYSRLEQNLTSYTQQHSEINWYPGVDVSVHAWNQRQRLKRQMDEFCTFMFAGCDAWENFGAFIITDKRGDNKFYNGPSYTNKYSSPQFSSASGNLLGIDFKQQTISFKIGLYYFTIEDYQLFLDYLSPYKIDYLSFGFADKWSYLVKSSAINDSPRYVMETYETGSGTNKTKHYWYYTELTLKFEIQGPACAQYNDEYHWATTGFQDNQISYSFNTTNLPISVLDFPFTIDLPLFLTSSNPTIQAEIVYGDHSYSLFNIVFENLSITNIGLIGPWTLTKTITEGSTTYSITNSPSGWAVNQSSNSDYPNLFYLYTTTSAKQPIRITSWSDPVENDNVSISISNEFYVYNPMYASYNGLGQNQNILPYINNSTLNLHYDSESGLLFLMLGDSTLKLLSLTTSTVSGESLVNTLSSVKFQIPGALRHQDLNNLTITFIVSGIQTDSIWQDPITCHARTNVI